MISVVILTKNEEHDLPGCLESVEWSDDVHVFDSFSDDATCDIARAKGAAVKQRVFDNYATQRNAALHTLGYKYEWVLQLDADERIPGSLAQEMQAFVQHAPESVAACRMHRHDYLGNTWLKHSPLSPFNIRLVRPSRVRYEREVHEILKIDGTVHDLAGHFDHYPFSKGLAHWIAKHNSYSTLEAQVALDVSRGKTQFSVLQAFVNPDSSQRRYHQKQLFYRMPLRPIVRFFLIYIFRLGFLDGRAGLTFATLHLIYEYLIVIKTRELEEAQAGQENGRSAQSAAAAKR